MKFKVGDKIKWHRDKNGDEIGTVMVVEKYDNHGCWIDWADNKKPRYEYEVNTLLTLVIPADCVSFMEKVQDRLE